MLPHSLLSLAPLHIKRAHPAPSTCESSYWHHSLNWFIPENPNDVPVSNCCTHTFPTCNSIKNKIKWQVQIVFGVSCTTVMLFPYLVWRCGLLSAWRWGWCVAFLPLPITCLLLHHVASSEPLPCCSIWTVSESEFKGRNDVKWARVFLWGKGGQWRFAPVVATGKNSCVKGEWKERTGSFHMLWIVYKMESQ